MKKRLLSIAAIFAVSLLLMISGCGGGGGGTAAPSNTNQNTNGNTDQTPAAKSITVSGTMSSVAVGGRIAGRVAEAGVPNASVIAYFAGDTAKAALNSTSDTTDANGNFSISVNMGSASTIDVIIEAVATSGNILLALDNASSNKSALAGNEGTTRKAKLFHYAPTEALDTTITVIDNMMNEQSIDVVNILENSSSYNSSSTNVKSFITEMKSVMTKCNVSTSTLDVTKKECVSTELETASGSSAQVTQALSALNNSYKEDIAKIQEALITLTGNMTYQSNNSKMAGRVAGAGIPNASIIAYLAGDTTKTILNSISDTTDANGDFSITVDKGDSASIDLIVEAVAASGNIMIALDDLTADKSSLAGNEGSTRKAKLFNYAPTESLDTTISLIDNLMNNQSIDVTEYLEDTASYSNSASTVSSFLSEMKTTLSGCGISSTTLDDTKMDCISTALESSTVTLPQVQKVLLALEMSYKTETGKLDQADMLYNIVQSGTRADYDTIVELCADARISLVDRLYSASEIQEFMTVMADAITEWSSTSYPSLQSKRVAVKDIAMAEYFSGTFTNNSVKSTLNILSRADGYYFIIRSGAVEGTSVAETDIGSAMTAYDNIRGMFIDVMVNDLGETRASAYESVEALLQVLADLGTASENTSSFGEIMDNWVTEWDKPGFEANLMTALAPFDMDDSTKTKDLMRIAHDLSHLGAGATDAQIEAVLNTYLSTATTAKALEIYNMYKTQTCASGDYFTFSVGAGIDLNLSPSAQCVSDEDIFVLFETHYGKPLPKLRAFVGGLENWVEDSNNLYFLMGIYTGSTGVQTLYTSFKSSPANKAEVGQAMDAAGIKKELMWLAANLEPYM